MSDEIGEAVEGLAKLREPFPKKAIGKLPRKRKDEDGNVIGTVQLDFVGHAWVRERLLDIDPTWTWKGIGADGVPVVEVDGKGNPRGLWIRLTVCGVTRLGYGSVEPGKTEAVKELIGDALRNAAMSFGVALDLWKKEEAASQPDGATPARAAKQRQAAQKAAQPKPAPTPGMSTQVQWGALSSLAQKLGWDEAEKHRQAGVESLKDLTHADAKDLQKTWAAMLTAKAAEQKGGAQ